MKILRINYMKIWLVSNILRNLNYRESFSRKIYFIIKAFQWRKRWSVHREMACWGGVKSTQNINIPENFMLLALAHILNQFLWQLNLILWCEGTTETPLQTPSGSDLETAEDIALPLDWTGLCSLKISQYFQLHLSRLFSIGGQAGAPSDIRQ